MTQTLFTHIIDDRRYTIRRIILDGLCQYIETVWEYWTPWQSEDDLYAG